MQTLKGTVSKVKVLKLSSAPLVRFNLDDVNCLIAVHSLNFLADNLNDGNQVVIGGDFNAKHQFIVKRYCVINSITTLQAY